VQKLAESRLPIAPDVDFGSGTWVRDFCGGRSERMSGKPVASRCKKCRKALDATDPGERWGRQPYCHSCVRAAGLGEYIGAVPALEENVEFGFAESFWRRIQSRFWMMTGIAGLVFGLYFCLHQLFGGRFSLLEFYKFSLTFLGIFSLPTAITAALHAPRRRTIWVEDGKLIERSESWSGIKKIGIRTTALALKPSSWSSVRLAFERHGQIWARPLIQVLGSHDRDPFACGTTDILCGYSESYRRLWAGYFTLRGLRLIADPFPSFCIMAGPPIGGMLGCRSHCWYTP
jgi:hypothetical protein